MTSNVANTTPTPQPSTTHRRLARRVLLPAAILVGSIGAASLAGATTPKAVVTSTRIAGLGTVLESAHRPLYAFVNDPKGKSTCTGGCSTIWQPLIVSASAAHHLGHFSGLKTIHRSNGKLQVAIHGHALYFFSGDHSQSHAGGQGFESLWFTVNPNGTFNHSSNSGAAASTAPSNPQPASSPTSSTTTTRPATANTSPAPTSPPPTSPPVTSPPTTVPPTTTTTVPPTTTTTAPSGGGVGF